MVVLLGGEGESGERGGGGGSGGGCRGRLESGGIVEMEEGRRRVLVVLVLVVVVRMELGGKSFSRKRGVGRALRVGRREWWDIWCVGGRAKG